MSSRQLHKTGVDCLYIIKLEGVDLKVLKKLIDTAIKPELECLGD